MGNNKLLGSIFIVAGTAIGGGMVAMPIALSSVGFLVSGIILVAMWLLMSYSGLLMIELYQYHSPQQTPAELAEVYLGKAGKLILSISMLILMFSLIAAYISGGGELFSVIVKQYFDLSIPNYFFSAIMAATLTVFLIMGTNKVDALNKLLFALKLMVLTLILLSMFTFIKGANLTTFPQSHSVVLSSLPLVFTAFGFHTCIQSLEIYLEGNRAQLKKVILTDSLIPLIIYLLWVLVVFGSLDTEVFNNIIQSGGGVNSISLAIKQLLNNSYIEIGVKVFVLLAIMTSFLGVSLSTFDYISTGLQINKKNTGRFFAAMITFAIPIVFVIFYPNGFLMALGGAAIAFSLIALVIPTLMVWQQRAKYQSEPHKYRVKGGKAALLVVFLIGCLIISIQLLIIFGKLPNF